LAQDASLGPSRGSGHGLGHGMPSTHGRARMAFAPLVLATIGLVWTSVGFRHAARLFVLVGVRTPARPSASCGPRSRIAADAAREKRIFYNYLTQDYALSDEDVPLPWDEGFAALEDFLPWSDGDRRAMALVEARIPNWRTAFLMPSSEAGVRRRWRVIFEAAGGDERGMAALEKNIGILAVSERITRAAAAALTRGLGREEAAEVVRKNPGVLAIKASSLQGGGLARTVFVANIVDFFAGPGVALVSLVQLVLVVGIGKALLDVVLIRSGVGSVLPL